MTALFLIGFFGTGFFFLCLIGALFANIDTPFDRWNRKRWHRKCNVALYERARDNGAKLVQDFDTGEVVPVDVAISRNK